MKRVCFFGLILILFLTLASCDSATNGVNSGNQGGGNPGNPWQPQTVTVAQAKTMADDSLVRLTGRITAYLGRDEKFTFADNTGSITVEIDWEDWVRGGFNPSAIPYPVSVEITGEVDRDFNSVEIDVDSIRGL